MIRRYKKRRIGAGVMLVVFCFQLLQPTIALALTSGPTQPEVQSFQPAGTSDMVDLFSGDFSYNIPLFELPGPNGGYPFNLSYQSGITMDQEASWVGLGWSLNPGAITRQMRGLPDEFSGDFISTKTSIAPSVTFGLGAGLGVELFGSDMGVSKFGLGIVQNNYKGLSYSIDASLGFNGASKGNGPTTNLGLNVSLDSKEGVGVNPSIGLTGKAGEIGLGVGYNSKTGLTSLSLTESLGSKKSTYQDKNKNTRTKYSASDLSSSSSISLAHPGYTPQVTMPMKNTSLSATVKIGTGWEGVFPSAYVRGFYNEQVLKNDGKYIQSNAYGYLNYQKSTGDGDLLDINREKEGMVLQESPNLASPSLTYDIYTVTGQGIGAMYRPMRNDLGVVNDQEVSSVSVDASGGVDAGPPFHAGGNLSMNHSKSTSGKWKDNNSFASSQTFQNKNTDNVYEPWYFKVHGEQASEDNTLYSGLGGDDAVRVPLSGGGNSVTADANLENKNWNSNNQLPHSSAVNQQRKSRNQVVQPITNEQLLSGTGVEMISLFKNIQYVDIVNGDSTLYNYVRDVSDPNRKHHIAGLTALTPEGLRYTYGIPAYNTYQEEVSYTAQKPLNTPVNRVNVYGNATSQEPSQYNTDNSTEKFLKITKIPAYAHSYLLTSIVGPDYVDVTDDGVTADDLGYWVKFTYQRRNSSANPFKWRDPYSQAHYQEGWKTDPRDDKGSYTDGEKELWYLAMAETKSHIAVFKTATRHDGFGVASRIQDTNMQGNPVYKLCEIDLFSRFAQNNYKIKTVRFNYDYSLCPGVFNSDNGTKDPSNSGKLTLRKLWFEYGSSTRGKLNPYIFTYNSQNPGYSVYAYDRWGTYKPYPTTDPLQNVDGPYSLQDPSQKQQIDNNAAAWSLTDIKLPSGGTIQVNYETDDYAYVQQQPAMQMMELVEPYSTLPTPLPDGFTLPSTYHLNDTNLKVRFKLGAPIADSPTLDPHAEALKYLDQQRRQLYFRMLVNLRTDSEGYYEYVAGYADIDFPSDTPGHQTIGLEGKDSQGYYHYGYCNVVAEDSYHPFSARTWQHLRTNQPDIANAGAKFSPATSNSQRISQIKSIGNLITPIRQMFQGFKSYCSGKGWGRQVVSGKSWIRLNSRDKIKYGGGLRVRQITIKDQWSENEEGVYGQVYEYTTTEGNNTISSGVAAYEPLVGGEENSIHYAKKFTQSVPLRSDNNLFFEYPINESYYPGPQVGYGKVTVTSLAAAALAGKAVANVTLPSNPTKTIFPKGPNASYGTTGMTVHEFYTAKDFPVLTNETEKLNKPYKLNVIIPFLGSVTASNLTTSQGYSIITNDMHGKQKRVSNYRQNQTGAIDADPISWVKYNYRQDNAMNTLGSYNKVSNLFVDNGDGTVSIPGANDTSTKFSLGQETEFFTDMRQFQDNTWGGGANLNVDQLIIPLLFIVIDIPIPTVWPNVSKSSIQLRTAVSNKIVFKSGILESTEAYDEGSHVVTQHVKWDKQTGAPVLTVVTNDFNAPVYSYQIPAYTQYQGMGAAYQNTGISFTMNGVATTTLANTYQFTTTLAAGLLYPGDELLLYADNTLTTPLAKAVYTGVSGGQSVFYSSTALTQSSYVAMITRSGYRNQLSVMAGSVTALKDPSVAGTPVIYNKTIKVPK